jgi:hydroxymethylbilane synthase
VNPLRIGTRGSQLALWQARAAVAAIEAAGGPPCELSVIRTSGDRLAEAPLSEVGGKRLFVKEIEDALAHGDVDVAVHSCKDMPADLPAGLAVAAVLPREMPNDAVVLPHGARTVGSLEELLAALGPSARLGTSSVRRIAELTRLVPGAAFQPVRGNLDTRLRKLEAGDCDALVLAAAGLRRLGLGDRISFILPLEACLPAPGQGAIALEIRAGDPGVEQVVAAVNDVASAAAVTAERSLVAALGGGCQTPIGAIALPDGERLQLRAVVVSLDGGRAVRGLLSGAAREAADLGAALAAQMVADGAMTILDAVRRGQAPVEGLQP